MNQLNFNVVFTNGGSSKEVLVNWENGEIRGLPYFETQYNGVRVSIIPHCNGGKYIRFYNEGKSAVTGFWGIEFPWEYGENCYTLVPALFYNGNEQELNNTIPMLKIPENPVFNASFCSASFPAVLYKKGNEAISYVISHKSIAGWNGVELDAEKQTLTFYAPAKELNIYGFRGFKGTARKPYSLEPGAVLTIRLEEERFDCKEITDLFDFYWKKTIRKPYYKSKNIPKIPEKEGVEIVRDWIYDRHCFFTEENEPIISNAFTDVDDKTPKLNGEYAEWDIMIGWCSGTMTALPLLHFGGKYRDFALKYIDFLATHGNSPSGVKYPIYDGKSWMNVEHKQFYRNAYEHLRFYCEYIYYLGKAIRFEKQNGYEHPEWNKDFEKGIKILLEIWEREKDFGIYWNLSGEKVDVYRKGSCAGAFALLALAEGILHFANDVKLIETFKSSCVIYYERCVKSGRCNGGPPDIKEADDSESAAALADALLQNYKLFKGQENLDMAIHASEIFASWVVNYAPEMPNGSLFENINVKGGVIANIQNRHVGPGICTNSGRFLYDLGVISGDERWIELYYQIKAAAINCITTYDGEFYGLEPNTPFIKGMLSEQINLGDSLGIPGETWRVSACWPATFILLSYIDSLN